jgi:hypothetical protein
MNSILQAASQVANVIAGRWASVDQDLRQWAFAFGINW